MADEDGSLFVEVVFLIAVFVSLIFETVWSNFKSTPASENKPCNPEREKKKSENCEEHYVIPKTGKKAIRRLLACKEQDSYSILGVQSGASDKAIKTCYRKQALMVHPDKNKEPGAEEAFKILDGAFKTIDEPAKRRMYDNQLKEAKNAEAARKHMEEQAEAEMRRFFDTLKEKINEARNLMDCFSCGGTHKRILTDRCRRYSRFCTTHNTFHRANENDVWAETSMMGLQWNVYVCMEQNIYDITEWFNCNKNSFTRMEPNSHHVCYKLMSTSNGTHRRYREPDIDKIFRNNCSSHRGPTTSSTTLTKRRRRRRRRRKKKKKNYW